MSYRVEITGWRVGLRKIALTEELRSSAGLGLADAKSATDRVLDGAAVSVSQSSRESAEGLATRLGALGAIASVREQRSDGDDLVEDLARH